MAGRKRAVVCFLFHPSLISLVSLLLYEWKREVTGCRKEKRAAAALCETFHSSPSSSLCLLVVLFSVVCFFFRLLFCVKEETRAADGRKEGSD